MKANKTAYTLFALLAAAILSLTPIVGAHPITPSLNWSLQSVPQGLSTTATANVLIDADCSSGQTYSGTITVTEPDGVSVATYSVPATACGTSVTATYPSGFTGTAGTTELGTYAASWAGSSSVTVGGFHPTFEVTDNFTVVSFSPPTVPEFSAPVIAVAAMGLVVLAMMKRGKLIKA
jgi:hypothetical protein